MNRSTRMVDTPYGQMLFSPVPAHGLEPGDLVFDTYARDTGVPDVTRGPWRVLTTRLLGFPYTMASVGMRSVADGRVCLMPFGPNEPVLRAVGARAAGVL